MRTARLRACPRQATAAERLRFDDGADHVPINIDIAVRQSLRDARDRFVNTRMDAKCERGAVCRDVIEQLIEFTRTPPDNMQDRPKYFFFQFPCAAEFDDGRRYIRASFGEKSIEPE